MTDLEPLVRELLAYIDQQPPIRGRRIRVDIPSDLLRRLREALEAQGATRRAAKIKSSSSEVYH